MMIQAMWSAGLTWDERLPDELAKPALTWFKEIPDLAKIKVPRCLKELEQVADSQLHVFMDASQEAYGAVAYLRHEYQSCDVEGQSYTTESYQCTSLRAHGGYCWFANC